MEPETSIPKIPNVLDYMHDVAMDTQKHAYNVPNHFYNAYNTTIQSTKNVGDFLKAIPEILELLILFDFIDLSKNTRNIPLILAALRSEWTIKRIIIPEMLNYIKKDPTKITIIHHLFGIIITIFNTFKNNNKWIEIRQFLIDIIQLLLLQNGENNREAMTYLQYFYPNTNKTPMKTSSTTVCDEEYIIMLKFMNDLILQFDAPIFNNLVLLIETVHMKLTEKLKLQGGRRKKRRKTFRSKAIKRKSQRYRNKK